MQLKLVKQKLLKLNGTAGKCKTKCDETEHCELKKKKIIKLVKLKSVILKEKYENNTCTPDTCKPKNYLTEFSIKKKSELLKRSVKLKLIKFR